MAQKYSRQREIIRNFMKDRKDHPTADTVYMNVRQDIPSISLGTVYRNLMLLAETGEIKKVDVGDGVVRFDPLTDEHSHFVCNRCGKVSDMMLGDEKALLDAAKHALPGSRITSHSVTFKGLCPACAAKEKVAV